jgi:hypothetical protein
MKWVYNDGGRWEAGYRPRHVGDCVCRAIVIATEKPYREVFEALQAANRSIKRPSSLSRRSRGFSPDRGSPDQVYRPYLASLGWAYIPIEGPKVRLSPGELPSGRLIVQVSKHLVAVIDNVIHDTSDCSLHGRRFVQGYFAKHVVGQGFRLVEG